MSGIDGMILAKLGINCKTRGFGEGEIKGDG